MPDFDVIIVGAGLSGLCCARRLCQAGKSCQILESTDRIGGRIKTDVIDGFRLDHGFQVFLTSYPEAKSVLDYDKLNLKTFKSGALVRHGGGFCRISDVLRHPMDLPGNLFTSAASLGDKLKIASLRSEVGKLSLSEIENQPNITTRNRLENFGFSKKIINSFFQPFFGGVFLEPHLSTSRRMFDFVFKMFAEGTATIPEVGMHAIPNQILSGLPEETVRCNRHVNKIERNKVGLQDGTEFSCDNVVIATSQGAANRLFGFEPSSHVGVTCTYFASPQSPINEPILVLNGDPAEGPINNLCVLSDVSQTYAPKNQSLISVTILGTGHGDSITEAVMRQAKLWYGSQVEQWKHLKTYEIQHALPSQSTEDLNQIPKPLKLSDGIFRCGDYLNFASIQSAMETGRKTAELILSVE